VLSITLMTLLLKIGLFRVPGWYQPPPTDGLDLILAVVLSIYCIGQFRLQSLVRNATPADWRRERRPMTRRVRGRWTWPDPVSKRLGKKVRSLEVGLMLLSSVICTLVGYFLWAWVSEEMPPIGFPAGGPSVWQFLVLIWLATLILMAASA